MKNAALKIALTTLCLAGPVSAQDYSEMTPKQLQEAATVAVDNTDRRDLMNIMKEMQERGMVWFRLPDNPLCDRDVANVGYFESAHPAHRGGARQWYFMKLREIRIEEQSCECLPAAASFDDLLMEEHGVNSETLTEDVIFLMRDERQEKDGPIEDAYRDFHRNVCRGD